ncbi:hypothetical protein SH501x_004716 [Pirellulaceae bacterium SH501]
MGRERYILPTDAELLRIEESIRVRQRLAETRQALIEKALRTHRKDSLIRVLGKLCQENIHARWITEAELGVTKPVELVLHDLHEAIQIATNVDEKHTNRNFTYDWNAYAEVERLMAMLVSLGAKSEVMEVAIHFMRQASRQLEYSDEGMMFGEIEKCLQPVFVALEDLEETQRAAWAFQMQAADQVGFVCHAKLQTWSSAGKP